MKWQNGTACTLLALLGACGDSNVTLPSETMFEATIVGEETLDYQGNGTFSTGTPPSGPGAFNINTQGLPGFDEMQMHFFGRFDAIPGEGTYQILPEDSTLGPMGAFVASYSWKARNTSDLGAGELVRVGYIARSGEISITYSSADRIDGFFEFTALRHCVVTTAVEGPGLVHEGPCNPLRVEADAASITVSGSFVIIKDIPEVMPG